MASGIHLYICIKNLNSIVENAEAKGGISKVFYSMDLLLCELDSWIKNKNTDGVYIEKLTGSRIHFVINTKFPGSDRDNFWEIVDFAYGLLSKLNNAKKLDSLSADYQMCMGADYGHYQRSPIDYNDIQEDNSIGNPANRAAKIQGFAEAGWLYITKGLSDYLALASAYRRLVQDVPQGVNESLRRRYSDITAYRISLADRSVVLPDSRQFFAQKQTLLESFEQKLNEENLQDYVPVSIDHTYRFSQTTNRPKHIQPGYVLYCDIRGSTKLVAEWANSPNFTSLIKAIMEKIYSMIDAVLGCGLDHIQVQGDRESAMIAVKGDSKSAAEKILKCAFWLQGADFTKLFESYAVDQNAFPLSVGIGISYGSFYRSSIGTRSDADNLLLGSVVNDADDAEDKGAANPNTIALTIDAYNAIASCGDRNLAGVAKKVFVLDSNHTYYVNVVNKSGYINALEEEKLANNVLDANERKDKGWAP